MARLVVGGVWVVAGVLKLPEPAANVRAVRAYQLLPEAVVPLVGHALPLLEVLVGACLLLGLLTRASAVLSALMLLAFVVGISSAWARGLQIDCGCFGGGGQVAAGQTGYPGEVARDVGLLLVALALARWPASRLAVGGRPDTQTAPTEAARVR